MSNGERQLSLPEIYEGMAQFPMATLEKVGQSVPSLDTQHGWLRLASVGRGI